MTIFYIYILKINMTFKIIVIPKFNYNFEHVLLSKCVGMAYLLGKEE
jgi:hypothetical protein